MVSQQYADLALDEKLKNEFAFSQDIRKVLLRNIPVSPTLEATVFTTTKHQLFVLISGGARANLADIQKIIKRMGLKSEFYVPPHGDSNYFTNYATQQFANTYPGSKLQDDSDLRYFKTLAPYAPALVRIAEISSGVIKQYDTDAASGWRPVLQHTYRRIKTK